MPKTRPQYHFRQTETGLDAWDVRHLIALAKQLPIKQIDPATIKELDINHWEFDEDRIPTPRRIMNHAKLIQECDISFPIILDESGRIMDGMHRVCRAIMENVERIPAVQFVSDPAPDFVDCSLSDLPYEE